MKKTIIAIALLATVACSAIVVASATKDNNYVQPPNYPIESSIPLEAINASSEKSIKQQIKTELRDRKYEAYSKFAAEKKPGTDEKDWMFDAEDKVSTEFSYEVLDILKKYNKIDNDYTLKTVEDFYPFMTAMRETLNDNDTLSMITEREKAIIEVRLEKLEYEIKDYEVIKQALSSSSSK